MELFQLSFFKITRFFFSFINFVLSQVEFRFKTITKKKKKLQASDIEPDKGLIGNEKSWFSVTTAAVILSHFGLSAIYFSHIYPWH